MLSFLLLTYSEAKKSKHDLSYLCLILGDKCQLHVTGRDTLHSLR